MPDGRHGYWDGRSWWTVETIPQYIEGRSSMEPGMIAVHVVLTVLTFYLCGGWGWVFLFHALTARRRPGHWRQIPTGRLIPSQTDQA
ncbi:hypothetical protein [Fodinicola feengrottensis]|nr:hypothetical protein [Fodinicola feengrottensis]